MTDTTNMTDEQKIEHLRNLINEGHAKFSEAAQFAGENNIPLKYIDDNYQDYLEDNDGEDHGYDGTLYFGGQPFSLEKQYRGDKWYWYNSNC